MALTVIVATHPLHGASNVLNDIGLESTLFDGAAAEQPRAVHVISVRLFTSCTLAFEQKGASTSITPLYKCRCQRHK